VLKISRLQIVAYVSVRISGGSSDERVKGLGVKLVDQPDIADHWQIFETGMRNTLGKLSRLEGRNIVVAIDIPELGIEYGCGFGRRQKVLKIAGFEIHDAVEQKIAPTDCRIPRAEYERRAQRYRDLIFSVSEDFPSVKVFDPVDLFCDEAWCYGYRDGMGYFYRDIDHLNENGSVFVANELATYLD
jgi:hypothetical protein